MSFRVAKGKVHALIGENGAGKSTLMKILAGSLKPDSGSMTFQGKPYAPFNPAAASMLGVAMIHQELNLAPHLTVEENMTLGREPTWGPFLHRQAIRSSIQKIFDLLDFHELRPEDPILDASPAQQQMIEIARSLLSDPRMLIMDEPTSSLTRNEVRKLFKVIERLKHQGVSIIYISHFLEEVYEVASTYTVLRDGRSIITGALEDTSTHEILNAMVGREIDQLYPHTNREVGEPVLETKKLAGPTLPNGVSLQLRKGEILGLAGLIGAGRTETVRTLFGLDRKIAGEIHLHQRNIRKPSPQKLLERGTGLLSEDRKSEGLMLDRSVRENLTLSGLHRFTRNGFLRHDHEASQSEHWIRELRVKCQDADQPIGSLSGGNQQKVAIARLLHHEADIFLLDEPTRGIDAGSKAEIYQLMDRLAQQGKAILFVSSYLPELLGVCDTIAVMNSGRIIETRPASEWSELDLIQVALQMEKASS